MAGILLELGRIGRGGLVLTQTLELPLGGPLGIDVAKDMVDALLVFRIAPKDGVRLQFSTDFLMVHEVVEEHFDPIEGRSLEEGYGLHDLIGF